MEYIYRIETSSGDKIASDNLDVLKAFALTNLDASALAAVVALLSDDIIAARTWKILTANVLEAFGVRVERIPLIPCTSVA